MTMISTIMILAIALLASRCTHDPVQGTFAMILLIVLALGLGFGWHDQSAEEIRNRNKGKASAK